MNGLPDGYTPDAAAFLAATLKATDHEYDYVVAKVGQDKLLRDIDHKRMADIAINTLEQHELEAFKVDEEHRIEADGPITISASDEASMEFLRLLANVLGEINGYYLTLVTDSKLILDKIVRTNDACLIVTTLEASLSPEGVNVAKERYIALDGFAIMKDTLEIEPNDILVINHFIQKIGELT